MKKLLWLFWLLLTLILAGYFIYKMAVDSDKSTFLIGEASHGHYQIEMACTACHTDAFGGKDMLQDACMNCHGPELKEAHDTHPKKKFTDPRNADRLEILDARYCITCHTEHQQEQTHAMGLTLPEDYCFHCHRDIGEDRESHRDLPFDSCASAGCHNFHDNRALYDRFLTDNAGGLWLKEIARIAPANAAEKIALHGNPEGSVAFSEALGQHPDVAAEWLGSSHEQAGITCGGCHTGRDQQWLDKPTLDQCQGCHDDEAEGYLSGRHGMRLKQGLSPMTPMLSDLPFKESTLKVQHGCNSCHKAHVFDTQQAGMEACLDCHNDQHSLAFEKSPHGRLLSKVISGEISADSAVNCATCHMPRQLIKKNGTEVVTEIVSVEHNQNMNLRPNEKMIRSVCMQCHNLEFSIDALADPELIKNNFSGRPAKHIPSIDWALRRLED